MSAGSVIAASWRRWVARAALVLAVVAAVSVMAGAAPRDQALVFWAQGRQIEELTVSFTREGHDEPLAGVTLRPAKGARERLRHVIALPSGDYIVQIEVSLAPKPREGRPAIETSVTRRVTLDGTETIIPLPESPR